MAEQTVFVTGGAGYVGAVLVPKLINEGYRVKVFDLMLYGDDVFDASDFDRSKLEIIKGDIRDAAHLQQVIPGCDMVIHLACISNDPSFELNPELGKSINLDAFRPMVQIAKESGVKRFIYASSSSVYGVKDEPEVHEAMNLEPLTDYSRFKADCEKILEEYRDDQFTTVTIRPATVCGYSPRQRLDVIVNILSNHAYHNRVIRVFGGDQRRPNIHIQDMCAAYLLLMRAPVGKVSGKIFNAGYENHKVSELADMVQSVVGEDVAIRKEPSDDPRSYHISSRKIADELGFVPEHTIRQAAEDLKEAFEKCLLPDSFADKRYFNIKTMQALNLK